MGDMRHGGRDETYGLDEVVFQAQTVLDGACCRSLQGMLLRALFASECERSGCRVEEALGQPTRKVLRSIIPPAYDENALSVRDAR